MDADNRWTTLGWTSALLLRKILKSRERERQAPARKADPASHHQRYADTLKQPQQAPDLSSPSKADGPWHPEAGPRRTTRVMQRKSQL